MKAQKLRELLEGIDHDLDAVGMNHDPKGFCDDLSDRLLECLELVKDLESTEIKQQRWLAQAGFVQEE